MKKNDIALIITIAVVCVVASYFIISSLFSKKQPNEAKIKVVELVKTNLKEPDPKVFHKDSINPAVRVFIGLEGEQEADSQDKDQETKK